MKPTVFETIGFKLFIVLVTSFIGFNIKLTKRYAPVVIGPLIISPISAFISEE